MRYTSQEEKEARDQEMVCVKSSQEKHTLQLRDQVCGETTNSGPEMGRK